MRVYFDYNATTPLAPSVVDAVAAATRDLFGNASSVHYFGQQAKSALDDARSALTLLDDSARGALDALGVSDGCAAELHHGQTGH